MRYRIPFALLAFCLSLSNPSYCQEAPAKRDADLTILSATVRNKAGNFVGGLRPEAFQILDGKEIRPIELFENSDTPMSIGLVVDTSGSITYVYDKRASASNRIGDALLRFIEMSNPGNEYFVMAFDTKPRLLADWKTATELAAQKIDLGTEKSNTVLYDAVFAAKEKLETGHYSRRALILVTDGQDNLSRRTFNQLRDSLRAAEFLLYGVGIVNPVDVSDLGLEGQLILTELAEVTGGEAVFPSDPKHLTEVVEMFATDLRHQYRLGFRTGPAKRPNQWRRITLKITSRPDAPKEFQKLTVRTRQGYYSK